MASSPDSTGSAPAGAERAAGVVLARRALVAFLVTFSGARVLVYLIMTRRLPDLYVHVGGTHVHHLNFGIVLLAVVGAVLLFARPGARGRRAVAVAYGVGLALTFDEFGMWLHLGGPYWQRASFDAIAVVAAALGLIAVAPHLRALRPRQWSTAAALALLLIVFALLLLDSLRAAERRALPHFQRIEAGSPP